jgi:Anti-sigma factor NepR
MTDPPDDSNVVRLGREEQIAIARGLRDWYQHVVDEGIPERMREGLERLLSAERSQAHSSDQATGAAGADTGPERAEEPKADPEAHSGPDCPHGS